MRKLGFIVILITVLFSSCAHQKNIRQTEMDKSKAITETDFESEEQNRKPDIKQSDKSLEIINMNEASKTYYENKAVVLTYHHIDKKPGGITITPERFESDLKILKNSGFNLISLRYLIECINGDKKLPSNAVVITFDDGYESFYKYAYPLLDKYNTPGTVFIVSSWNPEKPLNLTNGFNFLSIGEMQEMINSKLIDIQSHTHNAHNYIVKNPEGKTGGELAYKIYDSKTQEYESDEDYEKRIRGDLDYSRQFFKDKLNYETDILCFPFGHYNKKVIEIANSVGFKNYVTTISGVNIQGSNKNLIWRIRAGDAKLNPEQLKQNIINCANNKK